MIIKLEGDAVTIAASSETSDRAPDQVADPAAAVTITVQITVPNGVLPLAARRLVNDLRSLTETAADLSGRGPGLDHQGEARSDRSAAEAEDPADEPQLWLVGSGARSGAFARAGGLRDSLSRRLLDLVGLARGPGWSGLVGLSPVVGRCPGVARVRCRGSSSGLSGLRGQTLMSPCPSCIWRPDLAQCGVTGWRCTCPGGSTTC